MDSNREVEELSGEIRSDLVEEETRCPEVPIGHEPVKQEPVLIDREPELDDKECKPLDQIPVTVPVPVPSDIEPESGDKESDNSSTEACRVDREEGLPEKEPEAIRKRLEPLEEEPEHVDKEPEVVEGGHERSINEVAAKHPEHEPLDANPNPLGSEFECPNSKPHQTESDFELIEDQPVTRESGLFNEQPCINKESQVVEAEPCSTLENKSDPSDNISAPALQLKVLQPMNNNASASISPAVAISSAKVHTEKKKDDDKLAMYKALAIKLKKDLVKNKEELKKLRDESQQEISSLNERLSNLETTLHSERQSNSQTLTALELKVKDLRQQLVDSEDELQSLQNDYENYKVRASQIMQQNGVSLSNSSKTFEEERYKQLKELNEVQKRRISNLESQLSDTLEKNRDLVGEIKLLQDQVEELKLKTETSKSLDTKCEALSRENENLKTALKQFRVKTKESELYSRGSVQGSVESATTNIPNQTSDSMNDGKYYDKEIAKTVTNKLESDSPRLDENPNRLSPSTSIKDGYQTNSSSSFDGSTSGYVHIKPSVFEIINRSSEDGSSQVDNLTKAYLDSENTNALLSEQVKALKEEIRRLQRGTDRLDLAENLEYLKNVVYKFVSLDSSQFEQKQRLVPVLSTVLKLSPDETAKLNSLAIVDKPSLTSSFFKL